jgi:hypothetical protein
MKKILTLLFLLPLLLKAQSVANCTFTILNNKGAAMSNVPITLIETTTKARISKNTDNAGRVKRTALPLTEKHWELQRLISLS